MFFILSKTLNYLVQPLVIVTIFFLTSALLRGAKWKRRTFITGLCLLIFFTNGFIANEVMRAWEPAPTPYDSIAKTYDWGIVLTGVTLAGKEPKDRVYFHRGADRVTHAVQLYKLGKIRRILVTGGSGRLLDIGEREADDVKAAMVLMGVPPQDIIAESSSRNTHESAVEVERILASLNQSPSECLLITSAFHMPRSYACFRKVGLEMDTFATDSYVHSRTFTPDVLLIPQIGALEIWHKLLREWTGFVAYKIAGYV
ncbi:MAG: YdcF family protein [Bacteroidota bacterium]